MLQVKLQPEDKPKFPGDSHDVWLGLRVGYRGLSVFKPYLEGFQWFYSEEEKPTEVRAGKHKGTIWVNCGLFCNRGYKLLLAYVCGRL